MFATNASKSHSSLDDDSTVHSIEPWQKRFRSFDERMHTTHSSLHFHYEASEFGRLAEATSIPLPILVTGRPMPVSMAT